MEIGTFEHSPRNVTKSRVKTFFLSFRTESSSYESYAFESRKQCPKLCTMQQSLSAVYRASSCQLINLPYHPVQQHHKEIKGNTKETYHFALFERLDSP